MLPRLSKVRQQTLFTRVFDVTVINYVTLCLNVFTGIVTARYLGPSQKGVYYAVTSWVDMVGYLAGFGINQALVWYYHGPNMNRRKLFWRTVQLGFVLIVSASVVAGFLIRYPMHRLGHTAVLWASIGIVMLPVGTLYGLSTAYLMAGGHVSVYNRLRLIQSISSATGIAILAFSHSLSLNSYLICLYGTSLAASTGCFVVTFRHLRKEPTDPALVVPTLTQFMSKSFSYFIPSLSSLFNERLDQMICTLWLTKRDIGLYGISTSSLGVLGSVIGAFSTVFYPTMAQADTQLITSKGNKVFRLYVLTSFVVVIGVIVLSPQILRIFYGQRYDGAYPIVVGLAPVSVFAGLIGILYQGFFSAGKPGYALISEGVGAVSGALLIWLLAPRSGGFGVAIANSISYALDFGVCLYFWTRLGGRLRDLVPMWSDVIGLWSASKGRIRALFV